MSGAVPPPAACPLERAARVPRPVCPGCGRCGCGDPAPAPQRAPLRAGVARCGGGGRTSPGGVLSTVVWGAWCQALFLPRPPVLWSGQPGFRVPCVPGAVGAGVGPHQCKSDLEINPLSSATPSAVSFDPFPLDGLLVATNSQVVLCLCQSGALSTPSQNSEQCVRYVIYAHGVQPKIKKVTAECSTAVQVLYVAFKASPDKEARHPSQVGDKRSFVCYAYKNFLPNDV